MKNRRLTNQLILGIATCFTVMLGAKSTQGQVTKVWETQPLFMASESVVFDSIRHCLYVSNFNDEGGFIKKPDTLRNEFISKLSPEGKLEELRWIDHLHNPTGMAIFHDKLYVVEREGLTIVDMENQKIEKRIPVADAVFLNDIAVDQDGTVYISDTFKPCIHRLKVGISEVWYADSLMKSSNGLLIDKGHLLVGNRGVENLLSISLKDKTATIIANELSDNIDGIKKYKDGYLLSWKSELYLLEQGNKKLLYELDDKNDFLADFEFIPESKLIIIPQLMSNKVIALKLDD